MKKRIYTKNLQGVVRQLKLYKEQWESVDLASAVAMADARLAYLYGRYEMARDILARLHEIGVVDIGEVSGKKDDSISK